ncbi:MAG: hypothetical protein AAFW47_00520 [Pseudomonadota bacterium]
MTEDLEEDYPKAPSRKLYPWQKKYKDYINSPEYEDRRSQEPVVAGNLKRTPAAIVIELAKFAQQFPEIMEIIHKCAEENRRGEDWDKSYTGIFSDFSGYFCFIHKNIELSADLSWAYSILVKIENGVFQNLDDEEVLEFIKKQAFID